MVLKASDILKQLWKGFRQLYRALALCKSFSIAFRGLWHFQNVSRGLWKF